MVASRVEQALHSYARLFHVVHTVSCCAVLCALQVD
jgi:hypothetical protein